MIDLASRRGGSAAKVFALWLGLHPEVEVIHSRSGAVCMSEWEGGRARLPRSNHRLATIWVSNLGFEGDGARSSGSCRDATESGRDPADSTGGPVAPREAKKKLTLSKRDAQRMPARGGRIRGRYLAVMRRTVPSRSPPTGHRGADR